MGRRGFVLPSSFGWKEYRAAQKWEVKASLPGAKAAVSISALVSEGHPVAEEEAAEIETEPQEDSSKAEAEEVEADEGDSDSSVAEESIVGTDTEAEAHSDDDGNVAEPQLWWFVQPRAVTQHWAQSIAEGRYIPFCRDQPFLVAFENEGPGVDYMLAPCKKCLRMAPRAVATAIASLLDLDL